MKLKQHEYIVDINNIDITVYGLVSSTLYNMICKMVKGFESGEYKINIVTRTFIRTK